MNADQEDQAKEALQSLGDFHQGSWTGRATSFTVTADVAAGILQKKISPSYQLDVSLIYSQAGGSLALQEVCSWQSASSGGDDDSDDLSFASSRQVSLVDSSVDCDAVDASYSLHTHFQKGDNDDSKNTPTNFPAEIVGTRKAAHFAVEQCLAVSDDTRVRLLALYGDKQELIRVVLCDEVRVQRNDSMATTAPLASSSSASFTAADLLELQSDVDRLVDKIAGQMPPGSTGAANSTQLEVGYVPAERMQQLQDLSSSSSSVAGPGSSPLPQSSSSPLPSSTVNSNNDNANKEDRGLALVRHPMSLLELTSGVWLGDSIIRDNPTVPGDGDKLRSKGAGKGFGSSSSSSSTSSSSSSSTTTPRPAFGSWAVGVQKVAREWLWDFGEQIRQNNDAGKSLGAEMETAMGQSMAGSVCENQSLSRRTPKEERMVYIDWNDGNGDNHVGFIVGSVSIQVGDRISCVHVCLAQCCTNYNHLCGS